MPVDEELAERIRDLLADRPDLTEARMFGGRAFLVGGHMAVCASHQGGLLVRVDPDEGERLIRTTPATPMEMKGREVRGWLRVPAAEVRTRRPLAAWVGRGVAVAAGLPPKRSRARRASAAPG